LKKFADKMSAYTRQDRFFVASINTVSRGNAPNYASRTLAPAEVEAQRGAFYVYTRRFGEAKSALDQAMQDDRNLPIVHERLGMLAYYQQDSATAEKEFSRAVAAPFHELRRLFLRRQFPNAPPAHERR
jgi:Tfp pilus assembly protein PilF